MDAEKVLGGLDRYRRELKSPVRGLWSGAMTLGQFYEAMEVTITQGLTAAWNEGARAMGIEPEELTQAEIDARDAMIFDQITFLPDFAADIEENSRANGGKLEPLLARTEMWANRYRDAKNRAQLMAKADAKQVWILGPTEEHCPDCSRYDGRVYRASTWARYDIRPQHECLACHGFHCQCELRPTDDRALPGRPPMKTGC